ncbi:hypothetical protein LCGC14_0750680 [marine sediment metagenome]|uniref:Uncharacterized protein n=1 Tax=marine sediment metagenome TaxID=412755 RepID=A0A0F9SP35_9ZZZZ
MKFRDNDIDQLKLDNINDFSKLILHHLCGKEYNPVSLDENRKKHLEKVLKDLSSGYLNYEQFNEVLLLLNQNRISRDFFNYFFLNGIVNSETLKKGITKFKGLSILNFGNFNFTYDRFSKMKKYDIEKYFGIYNLQPDTLERSYATRPNPIISLRKVKKEDTWHLGYLSKNIYDTEKEILDEYILKEKSDPKKYDEFKKILQVLKEQIIKNREIGNYNTEIYLIWDYIDVYIATSMRKNCEYEETYEILKKIFTDPRIKSSKLRYFDPTQSFCESNRDKGLIEGLMLKRAECTIYMIQESDTFGKDSELASTLAQKKPVIAFIPNYNKDNLCIKIKEYPLEYIKERIYIFKAENEFNDVDILNDLDKDLHQLNDKLDHYLKDYESYREEQPFSLWIDKDKQFKAQNPHFEEICDILARYTKKYWDSRARTLKDYHPLGMQIDLDSGVSNGVLIVREIDTCVKILKGILTNSLEFEIKHFDDGYTGLIEINSSCLYRMVTDNKLLTNSFWNFFYKM